MLKILLEIIITYLIGAGIFFRVWLYRFPPKYYSGEQQDTSSYLFYNGYRYTHLVDRGWYTIGWFMVHEGYDYKIEPIRIENAAIISIFAWGVLTPIICLRYTIQLLASGIYRTFMAGVKLTTPEEHIKLPQPVDEVEQYAQQEVEKILTQ